MSRSTRAFAVLLVVLLSITACSSNDTPGTARRAAEPNEPPIRPSLPFDEYRNDSLAFTTRLAQDRLIRACMGRRGVAWDPPPISAQDANPEFRRYGLMDPTVAGTFGYHLPIDAARERRNRYFLHDVTAKQREALEGSEEQKGCRQKSDSILHRGVSKTKRVLLFGLGGRSLDAAEESPDVQKAKRQWSACMRTRGYRYTGPEQAQRDARWNLDSPRISKTERAVATADVSCKEKVSLITVWAVAEADVQRGLIAKYAKELEKIRKANAILRVNVTRALG
ncbi:hypothetical protein [Streptomyces sp. TS71-3]|uniref:hypothetical protein n=1 Tax=Streptomyces sp. TS71-3 TaxID=2733862 RepID=UPI001B016BC1|nr:hypothetical protein [Streptomyces sp. TS71-3]GHJ39437.1 hypothetical protein Sm713_50460 [Streptomyces sp. TS71-3]